MSLARHEQAWPFTALSDLIYLKTKCYRGGKIQDGPRPHQT
jgi:hypothetical protein